MSELTSLNGKTVLVTGATGFIGGRIVEKLVMEHGANVRVLARHLNKAVRIARFPVDILLGDLADLNDTRAAVKGCDVVFHCAWSYNPQDREHNLKSVDNIMTAAKETGGRVVYTSTVAFYQTQGVDRLTEETPYHHSGNPYADTKYDAEMRVRSHIEKGSEAVILQPSSVYGPWSAIFSSYPLWQLSRGRVALLDEGTGICNAVYIDDVADAHCLAARHPQAAGRTYLVSGAEPVTWREFYAAYEKMLGVQSVVSRSYDDMKTHIENEKRYYSRGGRFRRQVAQVLKDIDALRKDIDPAAQSKPPAAPPKAAQINKEWVYMPGKEFFALFQNTTRIVPDKIRKDLGFEPAFDLRRGMMHTRQWAEWANLLERV